MAYRTGSRRSSLFVGSVLFATLALVAGACGGDDDDSGDATDTTSAAATTGGEADTTAAAADAAAELAALLERRPTEITNTTPFEGEIPVDKDVMWIECPVPACVQLGEPLKVAVEALGWTLSVVPHDGTPEGVKAAYAQAVREAPDAVVSSGYPRVMFEEELGQLAEAEIPVVQMTVTDPPGDGIAAVVHGSARNAEAGRQLALYTAVDSGGAANVLWVTTAYPIVVPTLEGYEGQGGFQPALEELCPD